MEAKTQKSGTKKARNRRKNSFSRPKVGFYDLALVNKRNALYALRVKRPVAEIGGRGGYRGDSLHPFHNVAERGILPVQARRILMHNEELAVPSGQPP